MAVELKRQARLTSPNGVQGPKRARRAGVGMAVLLASLCLAVLLAPGVARAHASIVSSQPVAGERLATAPGVVVLRFTEPLNTRLSRAVVADPTGRRFEGGTAAREIRIPTPTSVRGVYRVDWVTVSLLDGHTLRGTFRFGVATSPGEGAEERVVTEPRRDDLLVALARTLEDVGLLAAVGLVFLGALVRARPALGSIRAGLGVPLALALLGGLGVVLGEALLAAPSPSPEAIRAYLTTGPPGIARLSRLVAEAVALAVSFRRPRLAVVPLAGAVVALAAAGHAAAVRPAWLGIGVGALHLAATGVWAGGILAFVSVRPSGDWRSPQALALLGRFSPAALGAFALTVATGAARGVQELTSPRDLVASSYGQLLVAKAFVVALMVPFSLLAWRRLAAPSRAEAALVLLAIWAAAGLAAYPLPPGRAAEAEQTRTDRGPSAALPRAGDLTLGGDAGDYLVGLTVRPGAPGRNLVLVELLPTSGPDAAVGVRATLSVDGRTAGLRPCGPTCRSREVHLDGGEQLKVIVAGRNGGTAAFTLPGLPAPDAANLLARAHERMRRIRTYRVEETLRPPSPAVRTMYAFQAPDRMWFEESTGRQTVAVGTTRYRRDRSDTPWQVTRGEARIDVPLFVWELGPPRSARLLGTATLQGAQTRVVAFFTGDPDLPVWFRQWIDLTGLVRRSEMRAQGHFMDERYFDVDAPFTVAPPDSQPQREQRRRSR